MPVRNDSSDLDKRYGRWLVTGQWWDETKGAKSKTSKTGKTGAQIVEVLCDCGVYRVLGLSTLKNGSSQSCGCLRKEVLLKLQQEKADSVIGKRFGRLTVVSNYKEDVYVPSLAVVKSLTYALCECDCGGFLNICLANLKVGRTKSCGCLLLKKSLAEMSGPYMKNLTGHKFGKLSVDRQFTKPVKHPGSPKAYNMAYAVCLCDCGNPVEVLVSFLRSGHTKSCGCSRTADGMSNTRVYHIWENMIQRCTNPKRENYKNYGGRGVRVWERWLIFRNFYTDMGDPPSGYQIDRVNNNGDYSKENCRWTTQKENLRNTRNSKWWIVEGKRFGSLAEAAKDFEVGTSTIAVWCQGVMVDGLFRPRKNNCYSEPKY